MKRFLCYWGRGSYDEAVEIRSASAFTLDAGYSQADIDTILDLPWGCIHYMSHGPYPDHFVVAIDEDQT